MTSEGVENGAPLAPKGCTPLILEEVKRLVESSQPAVVVSETSDKGRVLIAKRALNSGEVVVRELPLYRGNSTSKQCKQVFNDDFMALLNAEDREEDDVIEDGLDPESPLMDCISSILLSKSKAMKSESKADAARDTLRLRQMDTLCYTSLDSVPDGAPDEIFECLQPEFQELTSRKEIYRMLHVLSSNRFGTRVGNLEVMFAGSLFEHSCKPNCFYGTWDTDDTTSWTPRSFRALGEVPEGTPLSIDYLLLPDNYAPTNMRQDELSKWNFVCTCERCCSMPELTRAFVCPACGKGELCPAKPNADDTFVCLSCFKVADAETVSRCLAIEAEFIETRRPPPIRGHEVLSRYHWLSFSGAWRHFMNPDAWMDVPTKANVLVCHLLIDCISRLYGTQKHPCLVEIYNELAKLYGSDDLDNQSYFLAMEHEALEACYPEESCRQDKEALAMCQRQGPPKQIIEEMEAEGLDVMAFNPPANPPENQAEMQPQTSALSDSGSNPSRPPLVFGGAASVVENSDLGGMD